MTVSPRARRRLSIPFFFNATADFRQAVVPTTVSADRPAKYPPTSYLDGQGVVQGE
jgi:isopenicillin N synthase-like dioxygenase